MKVLAIFACLLVLSTASFNPEIPDDSPIIPYLKMIYDVIKDEDCDELRARVDLIFSDYDADDDGLIQQDEMAQCWKDTLNFDDPELSAIVFARMNMFTEDDLNKSEVFMGLKRLQLGRPVAYEPNP